MSIKQRLIKIEEKAGETDRYDDLMKRVGVRDGVHDPTHPLTGYSRLAHADDPESISRLSGFLDGLEAFGREAVQRM